MSAHGDKRVKTGVPGISYFRTASGRRDGTVQEYYGVFTKAVRSDGRVVRRCDRICISTMGKEVAWRKALAIRAAYELRRGAAV